MFGRISLIFAVAAAAAAQTVCPSTPQFTPCELVFDIPPAAGIDRNGIDHPIDLAAEFRSPHQNTGLAKAFWDGGSRWVIRFSPAESGSYEWKLTGGAAVSGPRDGQFTVTPADLPGGARPGWLRAANVHHFAFADEGDINNVAPHLWMGAIVPGFASMSEAQWDSLADTRAAQHFNHLAVTLVDRTSATSFRTPEFFQAVEAKLRYANRKGIIVDIAFFGPDGLMNQLLPAHADREKWFTYAISRLAAFDVTWQGIEGWETYPNGRELLKEIAGYLTDLDPCKHPRSTRTNLSSGPVVDDGWLRYRSYQTGDDDSVAAIDQQIYRYPSVDNFASDSIDTAVFRRRLWTATMNGAYPAPAIPNEEAANEMKIWYEFMKDTRHWELEPFFDVDNGRGLALEDVEYIVYLDKPGPVTVNVEKHTYNVRWFNPATGESVKLKDVKTGAFTGEPPDSTHDWVLQLSRESHKASMLKSYRFDSREGGIQLQDVEGNPDKVPYEAVEPAGDSLSLNAPARYSIRMKRESKALQHMMYEWTGEVTADNRSYRVLGTGPGGVFRIPADLAENYPAQLHVRIFGMNGLGKVYALDRNYTLTK